MSTGSFTDWSGNLLAIGPLYPFVGWEGFMVLLGFIFWVGWHIWQNRMETRMYDEDLETLRKEDNLGKALRGENSGPGL